MSEVKRKKSGSLTGIISANPWIIVTVVLAVILVAVLVVNGGITGGVVSEKEIEEKLLSFADSQDLELKVVSVEREGALYLAIIDFNGQASPIYVTLDGNFLVPEPVPLEIQDNVQEEEDWSVFESSLPSTIRGQILSFAYKQPEVYDGKIMEFKGYPEIPNTLIVFYHEGCGWCRNYYPVLVEAQDKYPDLTVYALDLGQNRDIAERYGVSGTPSNVINGKYYVSGYMPIEDLSEILDMLS